MRLMIVKSDTRERKKTETGLEVKEWCGVAGVGVCVGGCVCACVRVCVGGWRETGHKAIQTQVNKQANKHSCGSFLLYS